MGAGQPGAREGTRWCHWSVAALGAWLVASPPTLGHASPGMTASDVVSGALLLAFGLAALLPRLALVRWGSTLVGLWLLLAPLVFEASAAAYLNGTLVGALAIAFSTVVPGMPGESRPREAPAGPPGWSYNPSSWPQRIQPVLLAVFGFLAARHLAAYQLGHVAFAWDPFFGPQTGRVLTSGVSEAWPVSDAGLGAVGYALDALAGLMGSTRRWRTAPWIVLLFGVLIVPLGAVSITLVILQPVAVGAWCTLCLFTALISLLMIPLAVDEVGASAGHVLRARRAGVPLWKAVMVGGPPSPVAPAGEGRGGGVSVPWSLALSAALGLFVMASPALLGATGAMADGSHLAGPLVVSFAVIATSEVARPVRYANALLGLWIAVAPWALPGATEAARWSGLLVGMALVALSLPRGPVKARYGRWERYIV